MVVLKEITNDSWLVLATEQNENVGLLSTEPQGSYTLLYKNEKICFNNKNQVLEYFQEDVFDNYISGLDEHQPENFVKGYPINYKDPVEVDFITNLPLFKKIKTSQVHHCAGYYCIKFPKGWIHAFCPKFSTLQKYTYEGPFKTNAEMKQHLKRLRKSDK